MTAWYNRPTIVKKIPADQHIWFISDLHLGDGTPCDVFFGKDNHLIALIERVEREGAMLVIVGDAIDFHQAWSFTRVLRAHQELFAAMTRLGREGRLYYVIGNHDYDLSLFNELLNFQVCDELQIGRNILVRHGWQYDPYLSKSLGRGHQWSTTIHHLFERYFRTWLRIPLGEFYTLGNRLFFWVGHKGLFFALTWQALRTKLGLGESMVDSIMRYADYWARGNMGDSMGIFRPAIQHLREGNWQYIVCGHSHVPGVVPVGDGAYVNTGSWTFASSHYCIWDGKEFVARDWLTGRQFHQECYETMLDGSLYEIGFNQWWTSNYMGMLRYREGEERLGRLRGWESYIRDHQHLSHLGSRVPVSAEAFEAAQNTEESPQ
jgi:UDP-2,3-diacylglucosamine pyrophosphatase LpxH